LIGEDDGLNFIQLTVFLSQAEFAVLVLRLSRYSHKRIRQQLCITKIRYLEILNGLKAWVKRIFCK
jgi:hypothetical protein